MSRIHLACLATLLALASLGCRPEYPTCDTDKDCHDKEYCVGRKCQQCRDNSHCAEGQACNTGRCEAIAGWCKDGRQCPMGQACVANRCRPCTADGECGSGSRCVRGACLAQGACRSDDDCAQNEDCKNGVCVAEAAPAAPTATCQLGSVYFGFNESSLGGDATTTLSANAGCLKTANRNVALTGRADSRGTQEYNLALSERRAQSVKGHLERLGVPSSSMSTLPRGHLDAMGTDESGWIKDRRVDFDWR